MYSKKEENVPAKTEEASVGTLSWQNVKMKRGGIVPTLYVPAHVGTGSMNLILRVSRSPAMGRNAYVPTPLWLKC